MYLTGRYMTTSMQHWHGKFHFLKYLFLYGLEEEIESLRVPFIRLTSNRE